MFFIEEPPPKEGGHPPSGGAGFPLPSLAPAVTGHRQARICHRGGFEIALACDLLVAAENAHFGLPEVRRGLAAIAGGLLRLPVRVPQALAMELVLTGRELAAEEAAKAGLLNRLVPAGTALEVALTLAGQIASNAPLAVAASKQVVLQARAWQTQEMFACQEVITKHIAKSEDALEGARAFVEKRQPVWQSR